MKVPRSVEGILQHDDELAARLNIYEASKTDELDLQALVLPREANQARSCTERSVIEAIRGARQLEMTWFAIGAFIGTFGEAARRRRRYRRWGRSIYNPTYTSDPTHTYRPTGRKLRDPFEASEFTTRRESYQPHR